jgi:hypothetical protein
MNLSRRRFLILASICVIVVASALGVLAWNSLQTFSPTYLQVSAFTQPIQFGWYGADVLYRNATVAEIGVLDSETVPSNLTEIPVKVSISHEWGTDLTSLELIFSSSSNPGLSVALGVLEGSPWPSVQFQRTSDGTGVLFNVADLGSMGTATVTLNFLVEMDTSQQSMNYNIYFRFGIQNAGHFTFSNGVAEAELDIQLTRA